MSNPAHTAINCAGISLTRLVFFSFEGTNRQPAASLPYKYYGTTGNVPEYGFKEG